MAPFTVRMRDDVIVYTPQSSDRPRQHDLKTLKRILDKFAETGSFNTSDYSALTHNKSYTLALIEQYLLEHKAQYGKPVTTSFVTYENRNNRHVTIHAASCTQIKKRGGEHKYGQGEYRSHATYSEANEYARSTGLPIIICSRCNPVAGNGGLQAGISGRLPEEVTETPELSEGAVSSVSVNAYERNPEARRRCIEAHGTSCCICGFSFGAVYGEEAEGYIHVHHLRPLSEIGCEYVVDPMGDLRPVYPNCHAVIHLGGRNRTIQEVQDMLKRSHSGETRAEE
jgi:hypothetical protein